MNKKKCVLLCFSENLLTCPRILGHQVYRKQTHRYLYAESYCDSAQKLSAIKSLVHRAFTISEKEYLQTEFNHLKLALQKNRHDKKDIIKTINKTTISDTQPDERILSILQYVRNNKLDWQDIKQTQYSNFFKPPKKIEQILRNPKGQRPPLSSAEVYKISYSCGQVYIGETGRTILQIKEHQRDVRLKHVTQSTSSEHNQSIEIGHQILFDKTVITITNITSYFPKK